MLKKTILWMMLAVFAACLATTARADDVSDLRKEVEGLYNKILKLETKLMDVEKSAGGTVAIPDTIAWIEKIKIGGDFRYRFESLKGQTSVDNDNNRVRHRIRARLTLDAQINDELALGIRLASGSSDGATSTNDTLGGDEKAFAQKDFWLDRAFVKYTPKCVEGLTVLGGKFGNPMISAGNAGLIFDGDVNFDGVAATYGMDLADATALKLGAGAFMANEEGDSDDTTLWAVQGAIVQTMEDSSKLTVGASYYDYMNIQGASTTGIGSTSVNSTTGSVYTYDYNLYEMFGEYATKMNDVPFSVFGDYVVNDGSGVTEDTAWLIGCKYNKAKAPGTWDIAYNYRDVEADAFLSTLADGDFLGGDAVGGKSHKFGFKYAVADNVVTGTTLILGEADSDDEDFQVFQVDLVVKF